MNIHHLELFYYVATSGGISEATRRMPYGIQQPALSAQLIQLEKNLGVRLFQRRPFSLTPAGHELLQFATPFFGRLPEMARRVRGELSQSLRLGALSAILRDHLPKLLGEIREKYPRLQLRLYEANQATAESLLRKQEIELALTELEGKPAPGIRCQHLVQVPLVLLFPAKHRARSLADIFKKGSPSDPLIALPESETITRLFRRGLAGKDIQWPITIEASSLGLLAPYVRAGFGVAVGVLAPKAKSPPGTRALILKGFPQLVVAALWQGDLSPLAATFLERVQEEARSLVR